ncbi:MAG: fluoride efflux transporter CrcB [Rhodomicrobium sp.]|nr:fluoride efflux transporter CrcB [Rhodomicrobium sp.]
MSATLTVERLMLTYFYIALGGAMGSAARAWMANAAVRALGPHFPWGTILVNIVGSFIIGFFGALTTSDGRFTAHPDARAFVMIGICGVFTTFSSFSLQTLDLVRDGKLSSAFANIALSVILCLAAVTAGYASAEAINVGARQPQPAGAKAMGDVVVAVLDRPEAVGSVLSSAARLLGYGGGGTIQALAVRTPPLAELMAPDQALTHAEEARLRAAEQAWAGEVRAMTGRWQAQAKAKAIAANLIETEGDIIHIVGEYGRRSEAVVVAGSAHESGKARDALHAAIFDTSRAVLIAPPQSTGEFGRVVAVAWKDDLRAPKAVLAAMPILAKAEAVHVLRARVHEAVVPAILEEHGITAQAHAVPGHDGPVGAQLLKLAHELGADLIVMGAYAHGEWREALLGGVTQYMLGHADLPVLMRH